jgi:L-ascorbate metabolism protein UlaG (beta-lactamase superfamily)
MPVGSNLGFVIRDRDGVAVYFSGDVGATPAGLSLPPVAAMLVPVDTGQYVFSPPHAAAFVRGTAHRRLVVPMHYPPGAGALLDEFRSLLVGAAEVRVLDVGDCLEVTA